VKHRDKTSLVQARLPVIGMVSIERIQKSGPRPSGKAPIANGLLDPGGSCTPDLSFHFLRRS